MESESDEDLGDFVLDVETILARLSSRGISSGVESEISSLIRGESGQIVQLVFSRFLEKVAEDAKKFAAAEQGKADAVLEMREKLKLEKTWKKEVANFREKAEAAETHAERVKIESRGKLEKMKMQVTTLEEEISRFKTREIFLQREIEILVKSMKNQKIDSVATPDEPEDPEELVNADLEKETISLTFPAFVKPPETEYELSPSTILRGL